MATFYDKSLDLQELVQTVKALGRHGVLHLALQQNKDQYGKYCLVIENDFPLAKLDVNILNIISHDPEAIINHYAQRVGYRYVGIDIKISAPKDCNCNVFITADFEKAPPAQIVQEWIPIE